VTRYVSNGFCCRAKSRVARPECQLRVLARPSFEFSNGNEHEPAAPNQLQIWPNVVVEEVRGHAERGGRFFRNTEGDARDAQVLITVVMGAAAWDTKPSHGAFRGLRRLREPLPVSG
jgi:hypothetical protein